MKRDLFEAGLNEAAGSLAATYGRWSFVKNILRDYRAPNLLKSVAPDLGEVLLKILEGGIAAARSRRRNG